MKYAIAGSGTDPAGEALLASLRRLLERRWRLSWADHASAARVVVYCHRFREVHLRARDLAELPFPSGVRLVLLVRPLTLRAVARGAPNTAWSRDGNRRVLALDPVPGVERTLAREIELLDKRETSVETPTPEKLKPDLAALSGPVLGLSWNKKELEALVREALKGKGIGEERDAIATFAVERLDPGSGDELDLFRVEEALTLLTSDESASRHQARSRLDRPFGGAGSGEGGTGHDPASEWRHRRFLEFCGDVRASLQAPSAKYEPGSVLVLDDNPGSDFEEIRARVSETLFGEENVIEVINPLDLEGKREYNDEALFYFAEYQTLHSLNAPGGVRGIEVLKAKLAKAHYVLVDQLFRLKQRGRDEFLGPKLIRGLIRWMHDTGRAEMGGKGPLPEVLALSRTDDPQVIQAALRAGAKDYVLKSRFVSLRAVLARVERESSEAAASLHHNFRVLYDLPAETIGLLRSARIPRLPFHQRQVGSKPDPASREAKWASLLASLPKADLHVHAGSVMSREFLVLASLVMLVRHRWGARSGGDRKPTGPTFGEQLQALVRVFHAILDSPGQQAKVIPRDGAFAKEGLVVPDSATEGSTSAGSWIEAWGRAAKAALAGRLLGEAGSAKDGRSFRAHLHRDLGVRDYLSGEPAAKALRAKNDLDLALFSLRHAETVEPGGMTLDLDLTGWKHEDLIRTYLLVLATRYKGPQNEASQVELGGAGGCRLLRLFGKGATDPAATEEEIAAWDGLSARFFGAGTDSGLEYGAFRNRGWSWDATWCGEGRGPAVRVDLPFERRRSEDTRPLDFTEDPIGYTLATGTRSRNLAEYLLGCEFSGAEHLRHPFLIHVYARQVLLDWVRQGVFYAELKTSPDGFISAEHGFEHGSVVQCLVQAFSEAQAEVLAVYREACSGEGVSGGRQSWAGCVLGPRYELARLRKVIAPRREGSAIESSEDTEVSERPEYGDAARFRLPTHPSRLPCKTSLVFVGKRHKSLREMILEAAGAAVMRPSGDSPPGSARDFVLQEFARCRVVGFDLAGQEDGYPPSEYADEFGRLSRLHVPITVHAGENAPPQFIEDAILELGAVRIGHGLSLAEDRRLLARVRDERIAVELCPVCNHQTSQFHGPEEPDRPGRPYPLADFLQAGLYVTVNTDNPVISDTDMVREYFQASWAFDREGLSLWDALRIIRMGFVCSFLNLQERKNLLELVGQYLHDLFSDRRVVSNLERLVASRQHNR